MEADIRRLPEVIQKVKAMRDAGTPKPKDDDKPDGPLKQLSLF
jgi:hypothetical protein